jgi:putative glycosyltransferase (TIGR04372 family)
MLRRVHTFSRMTWPQRRARARIHFTIFRLRVRFAVAFLIYFPLGLFLVAFRVRFLPKRTVRHYGNLIDAPALHVRARRIGLQSKARGILLAPHGRVVNDALVKYWSEHYFVISSRVLCWLLTPFTWMPLVSEDEQTWTGIKVRLSSGDRLRGGPAVDLISQEYEDRFGDLKVLNISDQHMEEGARNLELLGIPSGAWWVALHVREAVSLNEYVATHRNADVVDYFDAVRLIIDRGGWVIRVGDPKMSRLPPMPNVVDYPHSEVWSDWMDIFVSANCRFLLSAGSGALLMATVFGRPVAAANYTPIGIAPVSKHDLFIPKLYWSDDYERYLSFREAFSSGVRDGYRDRVFEDNAIRLVDSTPEQITALTREMLDRFDGSVEYTAEDNRRQAAYKERWSEVPTRLTMGTHGGVGRDFLREYDDLLT